MTSDDEIIRWVREVFDHFENATDRHTKGYRCKTCISAHVLCKLIRDHVFRSEVFTKSPKPERKKQK